MEMTLDELRAILEDVPGNRVVRLMIQQSYPLVTKVHGIISGVEVGESEADEDGEGDPDRDVRDSGEPKVLYILDGAHPDTDSPSGSKCAWDNARRA